MKSMTELEKTALRMVEKGKGILAADESTGTIKKRLDSINVESTELTRKTYRNLLFTTKSLEQYISGIILFDETIRSECEEKPVPEYLNEKGIIPGIKVDKGTVALSGIEKTTEGLDGLGGRIDEYRELGAKFAKWRAVLSVIPSHAAIEANSRRLAEYAAICQDCGLVPIVEPEVLMDGIHDIDMSHTVTKMVLKRVFDALYDRGVCFKKMVLKPNMVLSGYDCDAQASVREVAERTVECLEDTVPASVPGIAFLSGGQSAEDATIHLQEMNKFVVPWNLTFSYGRALQQPVLKEWQGQHTHKEMAQNVLLERARINGLSTLGIR